MSRISLELSQDEIDLILVSLCNNLLMVQKLDIPTNDISELIKKIEQMCS